jgi:hypothetical protein
MEMKTPVIEFSFPNTEGMKRLKRASKPVDVTINTASNKPLGTIDPRVVPLMIYDRPGEVMGRVYSAISDANRERQNHMTRAFAPGFRNAKMRDAIEAELSQDEDFLKSQGF